MDRLRLGGSGRSPEVGTERLEVRVVEVRLVKDVEHLGAELHIYPLVDLGVLEKAHVKAAQVGPVEGAGADSAECPRDVGRKRLG